MKRKGELANANKRRTERHCTLDKTSAMTDDGELISFHRSRSHTGSLQENIKSLEGLIKYSKNEKNSKGILLQF